MMQCSQTNDCKDRDGKAGDKAEWVEKLAFHIACEPRFHKFMQNPSDYDDILMNKEFLAAVYLPGSTKAYGAITVSTMSSRIGIGC